MALGRDGWMLIAGFAVACSGGHGRTSSRATTSDGRDDFGAPIAIGPAPQRIASLNPTTTEILFALGAGPHMVGRTHWDAHSREALAVPDLGDGIQPNVEATLAVHPDLVLLYASASNRDAADHLRAMGVRVVALRTDRIADFQRAVRLLAHIVGAPARGDSLIDSVDATLRAVASRTAALPHPRVFWMLWESPLLTIGHGSYLDTLLTIAGGQNVYADLAAPSPSVSSEDVIRRDPAVIFASPSTIASIRADARWQHTTAVRAGRILAPDTSLVGQPSVHMGQAAASLAILLHPELAGTLDPLARR